MSDLVVHNLIARKIEPLLEAEFIDDSYSTRKEKGTLYGIRRVEEFVRECSENYTKDCYVMKLDVRSFFMDIHRRGGGAGDATHPAARNDLQPA